MKTTLIAPALFVLLSAGAFAQTPASTNQVPGPGVHKANITPAPQGMMQVKQEKKAERKAALAMMTPEQRTAYKADHKAKKAARLAAMTPGQRQAHDARKAEKKAGKLKSKS